MIQFCPARAKKKTVEPISGFLCEQKIDGQRYIIHPGEGCTSRRISEVTQRYVEKGDRVPHLTNIGFPGESMIDCEFVSPADIVKVDLPGHLWDKLPEHRHHQFIKDLGYLPVYPHVSSTTSIMGSSAEEAIRKQEEVGHIWAYAFDILRFKGQSTLQSSQFARRKFLAAQLEALDPTAGLIMMPQWPFLSEDDQQELYDLVTEPGGEGIILKDPSAVYNAPSNWFKWKKDFPVDAVLTGAFDWGTGKLNGLLGSLEIGVYDEEGELYPVGNISAIMDSEAKLVDLTANRFNLRGLVVECRHNGKQTKRSAPLGFTLRHPRFRRWRDDKNPEDCTVEALLNELSVGS